MNCTLCNKPIVLVPSAQARADKYGGTAADYVRLFTSHSDCLLAKRQRDTIELMRGLRSGPASQNVGAK